MGAEQLAGSSGWRRSSSPLHPSRCSLPLRAGGILHPGLSCLCHRLALAWLGDPQCEKRGGRKELRSQKLSLPSSNCHHRPHWTTDPCISDESLIPKSCLDLARAIASKS